MPVNIQNLLVHIQYQLGKQADTFRVSKSFAPTNNHQSIVDSFLKILGRAALEKSKSGADSFRELGNRQAAEGEFDEALSSYTNSLASSPEYSRESAMAYANRAVILFSQGNYLPCLLDVNRALSNPYPDEWTNILLDYKNQCLDHLRNVPNYVYTSARIRDDQSDPPADDNEKWRSVCQFDNLYLPNTSSKIRLKCDEQWGRYLMATEDIEPGEALSAEKFFSAEVITDGGVQENCSYCLKVCKALIPCQLCAVPLYCSKRCRTRADDAYHRTECRLWSFYATHTVDRADRLAIRALLIGTEQGAKLEHVMNTLTIEDIFAEKVDPTKKPFRNDYLATLTLCRTFHESLQPYINKAARAIIALKDASYFHFKGLPSRISSNWSEVFATALLVNHMYTLRKNEYLLPYRIDEPKKTSKIIGQRFLHSFLNHSCYPNAFAIVHNRTHVLFAQRPIKKDEQIFITYCGSFLTVPAITRLEVLDSVYDFKCQCEACYDNWPTYDGLMRQNIEYLSDEDGNELTRDMVITTNRMYGRGIQYFSHRGILLTVVNAIKSIHTHTKSPSALLMLGENLLVLLTEKLYGDVVEIQCTSVADESELNDTENLFEVLPRLPVVDENLTDMAVIAERLFLWIRKRLFGK